MAINAFLHLEGTKSDTYNVLKFDYKLLYETIGSLDKEKDITFDTLTINNPFDKSTTPWDFAGKLKLDTPIVQKSFEEYAKEMEERAKCTDEQFYPVGTLKGGFINFHILAQPTEITEFHEWLLDTEEVKGGSFCFTLSIGAEKKYRYIGFSKAYCVNLKETFASQDQEQMRLEIKILAMCISFGNNAQFVHEKAIEEEKSHLKEEAKHEAQEAEKILKERNKVTKD